MANTTRRTMTEAEFERMADRLVMRRLQTDSAYNNAEDAESQARREREIEREVERYILDRYGIER